MVSAGELLEVEDIEIRLLLEAIYIKYGYDFRNYAGAHLKRRLKHRLRTSDLKNFAEMQHRLLIDEDFFYDLVSDLSINVTEMFRDPWVYKKIREEVVPHLRTYPFIRCWHAGCSAGQEVYSMCILLAEEGIRRNRVQIYATDFNDQILEEAQRAVYPLDSVKEFTANYQRSGGLNSFSEYYRAENEGARITVPLRDRVLFSAHNLATDTTFGEMNVIFCRNVLIYFNRELQNRVVGMFLDSLCVGGFLCLGSKESIKYTEYEDRFDVVSAKEKIFRKKRTI